MKRLKSLKFRMGERLFRILPLLLISIGSMVKNTADAQEKSSGNLVSDSTFNARLVFEKLQSNAFEILPPSIRLDMLDYWDVDSIYKASNVMGGLSWISELTSDYAKITISRVSCVEIKILPVKNGKIAMTIYTVGNDPQAEDSQINFYDTQLKQLATKDYLESPELKDFFEIPKGSATKMKEIEEMIPFPTIAYSSSAGSDNLTVRLTVEQYMNQDDWNIARLFLKPNVTLIWKKDKYRVK